MFLNTGQLYDTFLYVLAQVQSVRPVFFIYFMITILVFRRSCRLTVATKTAGVTEILYTLTYVIFKVL